MSRLPAEWEPQDAVWLTRPENPETWPIAGGVLDRALAQWEAFAEALREAVAIRVTQDLGIATNDAWVRDYGPLFCHAEQRSAGSSEEVPGTETGVAEAAGGTAASDASASTAVPRTASPAALLAHDFRFNAWGGKYHPHDRDAAAGAAIADRAGARRLLHPRVLEGGAIDVDGRGTLLTTEPCLLHPNRNPGTTRADYEACFADALGATHTIWLPGGIEGDDTDGHVDDVARFLPGGVVAAVAAPPWHPDHEPTRRNVEALRSARNAAGDRLHVVELPAPTPRAFDYPATADTPAGPAPLPMSYANFLISNGRLLVPVFHDPADDKACRALDDAAPSLTLVPVAADALVIGLGTLHCMSLQQPACQ